MSFSNTEQNVHRRRATQRLSELLLHEEDEFEEFQDNKKAYSQPLVQTSALLRIILSVVLYYFDVVSDFLLMASLADEKDFDILAFVVLVLVSRVVFVSILDMVLAGGMGIKGVMLNLVEARMLYYLGASCTRERNPVMTKRAAGDFGLIEAVFESLPQTLLQAYLILSIAKEGGGWHTPVIVFSFSVSYFRLMITVSGKLLTMFQRDSRLTIFQALGVHLYFLADSLSRSFSLAVFFLHSSNTAVAITITVYLIIEIVLLVVPERRLPFQLRLSRGELFGRLIVGLLVSLPLTQRRGERWRVFGFSTLASVVLTLAVATDNIAGQTFVLTTVMASTVVKIVTFLAVIIRFPDADVSITLSNLVLSPTDANRWSEQYWLDYIGTKRKLVVSRRRLETSGMAMLCDVTAHNHFLQQLDLTNNLLGAEGCRPVASMISRPNALAALSLRANQLDTAACEILTPALRSSECKLVSLDLYNNMIGDDGMTILAEALVHTSLTSLNVGANDIGGRGAAALSEALLDPGCLLTDLSIWSNAIDATGAACLADALRSNTKLLKLSLYNNDIDDHGALCFEEALQRNETLLELNLGRNPISKLAVERLKYATMRHQTCYVNVSMWF
eukprot:TRINITY_DN9137_c0_g1_i4.p1 TRINITY_DN9137_c0_g1~~TRINITY_DN9137_c0_g1_i4.p1  ORF type:complete len:618 (+),score=118.04 TRINITY_DN9137_c0_g1_i4:157-2010(+)